MEQKDENYHLEYLDEYITLKLTQMQEAKSASTTEPNWVTKAELFNAIDKDVRKVLNKMFKAKQIKIHKTIHASINDFVEIVTDQQ